MDNKYNDLCPHCQSENWVEQIIHSVDFISSDKGYYHSECICENCGNDFHRYIEFDFNLLTITNKSK